MFKFVYLPTISLIVFVKTPFRARARDTAGEEKRDRIFQMNPILMTFTA